MKAGSAGEIELQQDYDGVIKLYEEILHATPGDAVAANNLALLLVTRKENRSMWSLPCSWFSMSGRDRKANGLEHYAYLRHLFTEQPKAETVEAIETLLPGNISKDQIRIN